MIINMTRNMTYKGQCDTGNMKHIMICDITTNTTHTNTGKRTGNMKCDMTRTFGGGYIQMFFFLKKKLVALLILIVSPQANIRNTCFDQKSPRHPEVDVLGPN